MEASVATFSSHKTLLVVAPATLEENFTFDVTLGNKQYTVTVPPGGVQEGEEFEIPIPEDDEERATLPSRSSDSTNGSSVGMTSPAPNGHWRTHLFSCCDILTQATFWMAMVCQPILIAQLLTRLRLNFKGDANLDEVSPNSQQTAFVEAKEEASLSFNKIVFSFVTVLFLGNFFPGVGLLIIAIYICLLTIVVGANIRSSMRKRYSIAPKMECMEKRNIGRCEDCLCMSFCGCCNLIQMARHTHNDKEYPGYCCTTTGLEAGAPKIL